MPMPLTRVLWSCVILFAWAAQSASAATVWQTQSSSQVFTAIPVTTDDTVNPLRGYFRWRGQEKVTQASPALDAYQRYRWKDLEPSLGTYDFATVLSDLQTAKSQGRKFALRVQMMLGYDDGQIYMPSYLVNHASCQNGCGWWADYDAGTPGLTFVPDWNDPYLQQRASAMLQALSAALGSEEDMAWIDIGLFGQWGEWALSSGINYATAPAGITAATDASKREFVDMHLRAFPTRQMVMLAIYSRYNEVLYATTQQTIASKPVGMRIDCLGRGGFMNQWTNHSTEWANLQDVWKTAPFVAEYCQFPSGDPNDSVAVARQQVQDFHISTVGNGNIGDGSANSWASFTPTEQQQFIQVGREAGYRYRVDTASVNLSASGLLSVSALVRNDGNAPSYEPWDVLLELTNGSGTTVWSQTLAGDLHASQGAGTSQSFDATVQLPDQATGDYTLRLIARDGRRLSATPVRAPLRWTVAERSSDGAVDLAILSAGVLPPINGACGSASSPTPLLTSAPSTNLCSAGTPSGVTTGTSAYTWSCAGSGGGSTDTSCSAGHGYTVTPSAGANGSISPNTAQVVAYNATPAFTVTANSGYTASVGGTCGGSLVGSTYTTAAVTAACSVSASFTLVPDTTPDAFSFTAQIGVALNAVVTSNTITVAGINAPSAISVSGGTYSVNGGAYTAAVGSVNNGDTVSVRQTASGSNSTTTTATLTIGGVSGTFSVTTIAADNPPPAPTIPLLNMPLGCGLHAWPGVVNMGAGEGPAFTADLVALLANTLGQPLTFVEQGSCGSVVLSGYHAGRLAFVPHSYQGSGDTRANGIYPLGDGRYQVVRKGQSLVIAPAAVRPDQLTALFPGLSATQEDNGVLTATVGGVTYVVQPGVAVQLDPATGNAQLVLGGDGYYHFIDALGNNQVLYPAFVEPATLRSILQGLDASATLSIALDGTATIDFNGQHYTLVPDLTLAPVPAERAGQDWWQESATRYRVVNWQSQPLRSVSQGFTVRP